MAGDIFTTVIWMLHQTTVRRIAIAVILFFVAAVSGWDVKRATGIILWVAIASIVLAAVSLGGAYLSASRGAEQD